MLFRIEPTSREGLARWQGGLHLEGPVVATQGFLMWRGGSMGWNSSAERMRDEGRLVIPRVDVGTLDRLAGSWNSFAGISTERLGEAFVPGLVRALRGLSHAGREDCGSDEARASLDRMWGYASLDTPALEAVDASERVDSKGRNFAWGLVRAGEQGGFVTDQTFQEADARRMAACWNAALSLEPDALARNEIGKAVDLLLNAAFAIASECPHGVAAAYAPDDYEAGVVRAAAPLLRDRMESGAFVLAAGSMPLAERVLEAAPVSVPAL